jgi:GNAT superfamily N-acetyltransferase
MSLQSVKVITTKRTSSDDKHFRELVAALDAELRVRDGEDAGFYAQFNKVDTIRCVIVAYDEDKPVGCGAIKEYAARKMEVKRMYVSPDHRGRGIATRVLKDLETWAKELGCDGCVLETGKRQPEAIGLYKKCGYNVIRNFGQYENVENSVCFAKDLDA